MSKPTYKEFAEMQDFFREHGPQVEHPLRKLLPDDFDERIEKMFIDMAATGKHKIVIP